MMDLKFYLKRPESEIATCVFARISYNGVRVKYYLPESIEPKFWNFKNQSAKESRSFHQHSEFNYRLKKIKSDIHSVFRTYLNDYDNEPPTPEILKELLDKEIKKKIPKKNKSKTFFGFFEDIIKQTKAGTRLHPKTGKPISSNTLKTYITTFKHLDEFQKTRKKPIDFNNIDLDFYSDFTEYLMRGKEMNPKTGKMQTLNLSSNTIGKNIQVIKLILNEATERGINTNLAFKSKRFITVREKSDSIYLTQDEINEIANLDLSDRTGLEHVRDLFLIGCFTGLRYSDYSILTPEQFKDGFIETTQIKTGEAVVIPIHDVVKKIFEKYGNQLPASYSNQKTNEYLKEIGKMAASLNVQQTKSTTKGGLKLSQNSAKWELLTTHTARRSFATNEFLAGTPTLTIMAITGHKTEKAFLRYIKVTPNEHAKLLKHVWERRNNLKAV